MTRAQIQILSTTVLVFGAMLVTAVQAQPQGGFFGRGSLLGLLRMEQVQKEMKLSEEETGKVRKIVTTLSNEMREQFSELRDIEDQAARTKKMTELSDKLDQKVREQLMEALPREKLMRLYQIRLQTQPAVDGLTNQYVARRLQLTDEQKETLTQIGKDSQAKQTEMFAELREASQEERAQLFQKFLSIRSEADKKALGVLTTEQQEAFEKMKGEKFELSARRQRQR